VKRKALGRGLNALIPRSGPSAKSARAPQPSTTAPAESIQQLPIKSIQPNAEQPRKHFDAAALEELAQSIRSDGVIQPILVRPAGQGYSLIAGERRWRAAQLAGQKTIAAIVRELDDKQTLEIALVENIQREDLDPIETGRALERLANELNLSHEELAQRTGKNRSTITNLLRLLRLPAVVQAQIAAGALSSGHARPLLALDHESEQIEMAVAIIEKGLSVRQVEQRVKQRSEPPPEKPEPPPPDPNIQAAVEELERALGTRVRLVSRGKKGWIEIAYSSGEELDRIYSLLTGEA
jgi:ParB family chromosome partitioning protein